MVNANYLEKVNRLKVLGVDVSNIQPNIVYIVSDLIYSFYQAKEETTADNELKKMILILAGAELSINSSILIQSRKMAIVPAAKVEKKKVNKPIVNSVINDIKFIPVNVAKPNKGTVYNSGAKSIPAPVEIKPLCECSICGEIALSEKELLRFFGLTINQLKTVNKCLDCK